MSGAHGGELMVIGPAACRPRTTRPAFSQRKLLVRVLQLMYRWTPFDVAALVDDVADALDDMSPASNDLPDVKRRELRRAGCLAGELVDCLLEICCGKGLIPLT